MEHVEAEYPKRKHHVVVDVYGKPRNWAQELRDEATELGKLGRFRSVLSRLGGKRVRNIVVPVPVHGTERTSSRVMKPIVTRKEYSLYRGIEADAVVLFPGEVYALASADCFTVAVGCVGDPVIFACHFSRETGVDGDILKKGLEDVFGEADPSDMFAFIILGIAPENFLHEAFHPRHGRSNEDRSSRVIVEFGADAVTDIESGGLNLEFIAQEILHRFGVTDITKDSIDTFSNPYFWSNRASQDKTSPKFGDVGRNLVLVANNYGATR